MRLRTVGRWVGQVRGMARHFQSGIDAMIREAELEEMEKKWREENDRIMREYPALLEATPTDPEAAAPCRSMQGDGAPAGEAGAAVRDIDDTKAPLLEHLIELRKRLLWSLVVLVALFFACLYFAKTIFAFLVQPLLAAGSGQGHLHRHFRGLLRRGEGRLVRGADARLPLLRDPDVEVRRARASTRARKRRCCPSCC